MNPACLSHRQCNMNKEKFRHITKDGIFCIRITDHTKYKKVKYWEICTKASS